MISAPYLEVAVVVLGTIILLVESFTSQLDRRFLGYAALFGLAMIFIATFFVAPQSSTASAPLWTFYSADALSLFFKRIALASTAGVLVMMLDFAPSVSIGVQGATRQAGLGEFFTIPLFTCACLMWMASAIDFVLIFVSLELVTISFYVLVGFTRRNPASLEAAVKYLVLSAVATGFLVYGITWIFGATGETNLQKITTVFSRPELEQNAALFGGVLVIVALGFKIAAVPFLILPRMRTVLVAIAVLTLIYGNLAALPQTNVKRLLAYSSIAHAGYLLVAVVSFSGRAVAFYLVAYLLMTLLSFAVLVLVSQGEGDQLENFAGLSQRSPFLAFAMLVAMASLAGVPFTAGFLGKFLVFDAAVSAQHFGLVVVAVITVGAGFYYYFKVVRAIYWDAPPSSADKIIVSPLTRFAIIAMIAGTFLLGVYPQPIFDALR